MIWVNYQGQPIVCYECKQVGHIAADCPGKRLDDEDLSGTDSESEDETTSDMVEAFERKDDEKRNKRERDASGVTPDAKKPTASRQNGNLGIDPENPNDVAWRIALDTTTPEGTICYHRTVPKKTCVVCNKGLNVRKSPGGLILARCTCNDKTRRNVMVKCVKKDCRRWINFPEHGKRVICECTANVYVCRCGCMHTVSNTDTQYECFICNERSDPTPSC